MLVRPHWAQMLLVAVISTPKIVCSFPASVLPSSIICVFMSIDSQARSFNVLLLVQIVRYGLTQRRFRCLQVCSLPPRLEQSAHKCKCAVCFPDFAALHEASFRRSGAHSPANSAAPGE